MKKTLAVTALLIFLLSACNGSASSYAVSENPENGFDYEPSFTLDHADPVELPPPVVHPPPARAPVPPGQLDAIRYAQGNQANTGIVTEDEENVYFVNHLDNSAIYVFNKRTQEVRKLEGTYHAVLLHLRGEYIYYAGIHYEAGFFTYRIRTDGSGREQAFEDPGDVLRFPQHEEELYYMHLFPERRQYRLDRRTGEKTFVFEDLFISNVTSDRLERMWFVDVTNLISHRLFEYDVLTGQDETKEIDIAARIARDLQFLDGYVYYRDIGSVENGTVFRINTQTYEETVIVPGEPTVERRVSPDNTVRYFIVPGAATIDDRIIFNNLLVTDKYFFLP